MQGHESRKITKTIDDGRQEHTHQPWYTEEKKNKYYSGIEEIKRKFGSEKNEMSAINEPASEVTCSINEIILEAEDF